MLANSVVAVFAEIAVVAEDLKPWRIATVAQVPVEIIPKSRSCAGVRFTFSQLRPVLVSVIVDVIDGKHRFTRFTTTGTDIAAVSLKHRTFEPLIRLLLLPPDTGGVAFSMLFLVLTILVRVVRSGLAHTFRMNDPSAVSTGVLPVILPSTVLGVYDCEIIKRLLNTTFLANSEAWLLIVCHHDRYNTT